MLINQLYHKEIGSGPNIYFLHGFGLNSAAFEPLIPYLKDLFCLNFIDLPACGRSKDIITNKNITTENICNILSEIIEKDSLLLGWSLGGLIAIQLAHSFPNLISKLILVSTTPNFTTNNDWQAGIENEQFEAFKHNFLNNTEQTIDNFIKLQLRGSVLSEPEKKQLQKQLQLYTTKTSVLKKYLAILEDTNLITLFSEIKQDILVIYGKYDKMIPYKYHQQILSLNENLEYHLFARAAHAPQLTNPAEFCNKIINFYEKKH